MYCVDCGTKLKSIKYEPSSWEYKYECPNCKLKMIISQGDMGSSDSYHFNRTDQKEKK